MAAEKVPLAGHRLVFMLRCVSRRGTDTRREATEVERSSQTGTAGGGCAMREGHGCVIRRLFSTPPGANEDLNARHPPLPPTRRTPLPR